jgi:hypothetical protein
VPLKAYIRFKALKAMKKENLEDREIILLTAGMVAFIGLFTLITKKVISGFATSKQRKKHAYLRLPKSFIKKYLKRKGTKIKFEFTDDRGQIKLNFIGYTKDNDECIRKKMDRIDLRDQELYNIDFGVFTEDEEHEPLNHILVKEPLRDWFLSPEKYPEKEDYVRYELSDFDPCTPRSTSYLAYKINPCPPGCQ